MNHNEPAFPAAPNPNYTDDASLGQRGMTVRQYYKASAVIGLCAGGGKRPVKDFAIDAALIADAMLAEDEQHANQAHRGGQET